MTEAIISALITGSLSLAGVVITCLVTSKKSEKNMAVSQAVTDTKIAELTREVREHNNFAQRTPLIEQRVAGLEKRVNTLEKYHQAPIK